MKREPKSKQEKAFSRRRILIIAAAMILAIGTEVAGIIQGNRYRPSWTGSVLLVCCLLPPIFIAVNLVLTYIYSKRMEKPDFEELNRYLFSQRELAKKTYEQSYRFLRLCRRLTDAYAILIACLGLLIAFCAGIRYDNNTFDAFFPLYAVFLLIAALSRIRFQMPAAFMEEDDSLYVSKDEYPNLYANAEKAAAEMGCKKRIRIALIHEGNVGIGEYGDTISIMIGVFPLNIMSDRELYSVFLHEFAHLTNNSSRTEDRFGTWLQYGKVPTGFNAFDAADALFLFPDMIGEFRYIVYQHATAVIREETADRAMLRSGDKDIAASALIKVSYYDRFEYEEGTYDHPSDYEEEQIPHDAASQRLAHFKERIGLRSKLWNELIDSEILSRSATHPTLKMRLEAFGVSERQTLPDECPPAYDAERKKAVAFLDSKILQLTQEEYEEKREEYYLKPLHTVEDWEAKGNPVVAEEYGDVVISLHSIGRHTDAEKLCETAISTLPDAAAMFAYFEKGRLLLHHYDPAGIEYIYKAVNGNQNYIEMGLNEIGHFCCLTGNEEELERYRTITPKLMQKKIDVYSEIDELKKGDKLEPEHLPDGVLQDILSHIRSSDPESVIDSIYLIRKTVTDDFFTSAFVVRFADDCSFEQRDGIMKKIFTYLDTVSDWQYSLFDYNDVRKIGIEKIEGSLVYQRGKKDESETDQTDKRI